MAPTPADRPASAPWRIVIDEIEVRGSTPSAAAIASAVERSVLRASGGTARMATRSAVAREVAGAVTGVVPAPAREDRLDAPRRAGS
ncbi:MAG: hypothetical protein L0H79_01370 [Intrasporangium sp.]|uniref:hypothetical protein n=1 Tax=Intrasporangium sp. TaxID=1925024 RepID=UPI0026493F29|nr:hypothetical protein [Intrasporangium sp.]MDN5794385.1 hypothetical protein [Intrasporangium sp.]